MLRMGTFVRLLNNNPCDNKCVSNTVEKTNGIKVKASPPEKPLTLGKSLVSKDNNHSRHSLMEAFLRQNNPKLYSVHRFS